MATPKFELALGLVRELSRAREMLSWIGKAQPRTTARDIGFLSGIECSATVHYQDYDGAKNYHSNKTFDVALARVVKKRFDELSAQALKLMESDADALMAKSESELRGALKSVDEAKARLADGGAA